VVQTALLAATKITGQQLSEKSAAQTVDEVLHDLQKRA
jgi:F0F1-type ATP synthase membrane subunit b/b'